MKPATDILRKRIAANSSPAAGYRNFLQSGALAVAFVVCGATAFCQAPHMYHPMHHNMPPGQAAAWFNTIRGYNPAWLQPIRIELPGEGTVSVYSGSAQPVGQMGSPAQLSVNAGHLYRLRIADMPEFPGEQVFPSVELLDHLHPPAGQENDFPVPIVFTADDIKLAVEGRLVTKVIYLEQPQLAVTRDPLRGEIPQSISPADNALLEADQRGRPIAIIRIGGRIPSEYGMPLWYYGTGGAVNLQPYPSTPAGVARLSSKKNSGTEFAGR